MWYKVMQERYSNFCNIEIDSLFTKSASINLWAEINRITQLVITQLASTVVLARGGFKRPLFLQFLTMERIRTTPLEPAEQNWRGEAVPLGVKNKKRVCAWPLRQWPPPLPHTGNALYIAFLMKSFAGLVEQVGIATRKWQQPLVHVPVKSHINPQQSMFRWVPTICWLRSLAQAAGNLWDLKEASTAKLK